MIYFMEINQDLEQKSHLNAVTLQAKLLRIRGEYIQRVEKVHSEIIQQIPPAAQAPQPLHWEQEPLVVLLLLLLLRAPA